MTLPSDYVAALRAAAAAGDLEAAAMMKMLGLTPIELSCSSTDRLGF